ncbi:dihydrodipicolinate synthase [Bifidobacterium margollesii]|uniref:Dihydrodipicolinate synthase n=1 Tax=Bifidobacterium margollesii TaxID=2020964 RepID=A0A2N5JAP5_9BIFI|nr:dihydrodipicolinate synthase family protein [Bifidobacterium margollesii]PLS31278.1 dihydrodipicolinate synthase [Bifidobacterium margollesii]
MSGQPEIITAGVTAFDERGELDAGANLAFLRRIEPYVDGVLPVGTNGEFPALNAEERAKVIGWALEVFGPERAIAHVGAPSVHQALEHARAAAALGATRFAAITPYYLTASVEGVIGYYQSLRDAVDGELYAYIFPDVACTDVLPETLAELARIGIDGVKLSGLASTRVEAYREAAPDLALWSGNDADLPHVYTAGGRGVVSGVSGVAPQAWAALRDAYGIGEQSVIDEAQTRVQALVKVLGPSISRLKYGLMVLGIPVGECRMPIDEPSEEIKEEIRTVLHNTGITE